jgi:hypothetical protein
LAYLAGSVIEPYKMAAPFFLIRLFGGKSRMNGNYASPEAAIAAAAIIDVRLVILLDRQKNGR